MNTPYELPQDIMISALVEASRLGLPADVQELLLHGDVTHGIPANILPKMLLAAIQRHESMSVHEVAGLCAKCGAKLFTSDERKIGQAGLTCAPECGCRSKA